MELIKVQSVSRKIEKSNTDEPNRQYNYLQKIDSCSNLQK